MNDTGKKCPDLAMAVFSPADRVSDHFYRHEFACKCGCGFEAVDIELVFVLEGVRAHFGGRRLHIKSGCRCWYRNRNIPGAAPDSMHLKAIAADFWIEGVPADDVADYLEGKYPGCYGIGRYDNRTHLDVRTYPARWDERKPRKETH